MNSSGERKIYTSDICISGKRISAMREIAQATFGQEFLFIEVNNGRFVVHVKDNIDIDDYEYFTEKYILCKVRIYQETDIVQIRAKKKK